MLPRSRWYITLFVHFLFFLVKSCKLSHSNYYAQTPRIKYISLLKLQPGKTFCSFDKYSGDNSKLQVVPYTSRGDDSYCNKSDSSKSIRTNTWTRWKMYTHNYIHSVICRSQVDQSECLIVVFPIRLSISYYCYY